MGPWANSLPSLYLWYVLPFSSTCSYRLEETEAVEDLDDIIRSINERQRIHTLEYFDIAALGPGIDLDCVRQYTETP